MDTTTHEESSEGTKKPPSDILWLFPEESPMGRPTLAPFLLLDKYGNIFVSTQTSETIIRASGIKVKPTAQNPIYMRLGVSRDLQTLIIDLTEPPEGWASIEKKDRLVCQSKSSYALRLSRSLKLENFPGLTDYSGPTSPFNTRFFLDEERSTHLRKVFTRK
jgi:hypothetical protein